jgi:hypothetical protein
MRTSRLLLLIAASLAAPLTARAQQVGTQTTCLIPLDAGATGTETATCPPVLLNYQPFTVVCETSTTSHTSTVGTTTFQLSNDGVNYAGDGGVALPFSVAASTTLGTAASMSPTNPWLYGQLQTIATQDGGTVAGQTCVVSTINAQTIHLPKRKLTVGAKPSPAVQTESWGN